MLKNIMIAALLAASACGFASASTDHAMDGTKFHETFAYEVNVEKSGDLWTWVEYRDEHGIYTEKTFPTGTAFPTEPYTDMRLMYFPESGRLDLVDDLPENCRLIGSCDELY